MSKYEPDDEETARFRRGFHSWALTAEGVGWRKKWAAFGSPIPGAIEHNWTIRTRDTVGGYHVSRFRCSERFAFLGSERQTLTRGRRPA